MGIVTGVSILSPKRSKAINVALLGLDSYDQVQAAFKRSKDELSEILSAFEFWDQEAIKLVKQHLVAGAHDPLESIYPFYVLIETSGSNKDHDDEKLNNFLEKLLGDNVVQDGVVAQDSTQIHNLWAIREGIPEACSKAGAVYKYDISMPISVIYEAVEDMKKRLVGKDVMGDGKLFTSVIGYGHVGDGKFGSSLGIVAMRRVTFWLAKHLSCALGNLHLNVAAKEYSEEATNLIEPFIFEWIGKQTISMVSPVSPMRSCSLH